MVRRLSIFGCCLMLARGGLPATNRVAVYLDFEGPPSAASVEAMKSEAARLVEPVSLPLEWRLLGEDSHEPARGLVVVRLAGKCASEESRQPVETVPVTLGSTVVVDGKVMPYCRIECDAVRRFLAGVWVPGDQQRKDTEFGRALGHVLAHELYHVLLRTTHHHSSGFTKALQTPWDLTSEASALRGLQAGFEDRAPKDDCKAPHRH